jgi:hypothetical protein
MTADRTAGIARSGIARHRAPQRGLTGLMRDIASSAAARMRSARSRLGLLPRPRQTRTGRIRTARWPAAKRAIDGDGSVRDVIASPAPDRDRGSDC